jgi:hypothetical protein
MWGSRGIAPRFLASELDEGQWSTSRHSRFIPVKTARGTHRIGGWVAPRGNTDSMEKCLYHRLVGRLVDNELKGIRKQATVT